MKRVSLFVELSGSVAGESKLEYEVIGEYTETQSSGMVPVSGEGSDRLAYDATGEYTETQ